MFFSTPPPTNTHTQKKNQYLTMFTDGRPTALRTTIVSKVIFLFSFISEQSRSNVDAATSAGSIFAARLVLFALPVAFGSVLIGVPHCCLHYPVVYLHAVYRFITLKPRITFGPSKRPFAPPFAVRAPTRSSIHFLRPRSKNIARIIDATNVLATKRPYATTDLSSCLYVQRLRRN